eukprot:2034563-Rhodomonas_salina.1
MLLCNRYATSGTDPCSVLASRMMLRGCYAISGTDLLSASTSDRAHLPLRRPLSRLSHPGISLPASYAMPETGALHSTNILLVLTKPYFSTRRPVLVLRDVRY